MSRRLAFLTLFVLSTLLGGAGPSRADEDSNLITDWYRSYLKRDPESWELTNYLSQLKRGTLPSEVKAEVLGSEDYFKRFNRDPARFITGLFRDIRDRVPTSNETNYWMDELTSLKGDRVELARRFLRAFLRPEPPWLNTNDIETIRIWYRKYLGRPADKADVESWVQRLKQGWSMLDVQAGILGSAEYFDRYKRDPARFIAALYDVVEGAPPWPQDVRYWQSLLDQLNGDRQALARRLLIALPRRSQPQPFVPQRLPEVVERMAAATRQLREDAQLELAGTAQGRQVLLRANSLVDAGQHLREMLQQRGYLVEQVRTGLDDIEEANHAVATQLADPPGTAPRSMQSAREVETYVATARAGLPPTALPAVPGTPVRPRPTFDVDTVLRSLRPVLRDNTQMLSVLRGLADRDAAYQGLARDMDAFAAQVDAFRTELRAGTTLPELRTAFQPVRRQEQRINRALAAINPPATVWQAWRQVEQDLAPITASLGLTPETVPEVTETTLESRPLSGNLPRTPPANLARPTTVVGVSDAAVSEIDAFLTTLRPLVLSNPAVPRLQADLRNVRNDLIRLRQSAAAGASPQDLATRYRDVTQTFERAQRQWESIGSALPRAEAAQWTRVDQALQQLRPLGAGRSTP